MKKSIKFLLAAVAVVLGMTSCDEFRSLMDNPVGSYLEIEETAVTLPSGAMYDLKVSTISDQGVVTAIAEGTTTIYSITTLEVHSCQVKATSSKSTLNGIANITAWSETKDTSAA